MPGIALKTSWLAAAAGVLLLVPSVAGAHALLLDPPPRSAEDGNKTGPCDTTPIAAPTRTAYAPGQTFTLEFMETIDHPGHFRVAFAPEGEVGFDQNILVDNIADKVGGNMNYQVQVTLPTTPCENCTLQLIQCMTDGGQPCSNYYSCANIRIGADVPDAGPGPGPGTADAAPGAPDAGVGSGADGGNPVDNGVGDPPGIGCSAAGGGRGSTSPLTVAAMLGFGAAFLLVRRELRRARVRCDGE